MLDALILAVAFLVVGLMVTAIIIGERGKTRIVHRHARRLERLLESTLDQALTEDEHAELRRRRLRRELEQLAGSVDDGGF